MRIIKLGDKVFATSDEVIDYFVEYLPGRSPPGKFRFPAGKIAEGGLVEDEAVVFTHLGKVVYKARTASGPLENTDEYRGEYPCFFVIDMKTVARTAMLSISALEDMLRKTGWTGSLRRAWLDADS